ncbi:transposase [Poseidonocella sp. HB161398]|uniref:transposase n=1 Tax=Poseidonocella sp. HB161398 TaxID=2320855 RepID=UPI00148659BE
MGHFPAAVCLADKREVVHRRPWIACAVTSAAWSWRSDAHDGTKAATARGLSNAWQRCRVHFRRNACADAGKSRRGPSAPRPSPKPVHAAVRTQQRLADGRRCPELPMRAMPMDRAEEDVLARMSFPAGHRARRHDTNPIARPNGEIGQRANVSGVRAFLRTGGRHALPSRRGPDPAPRRRYPIEQTRERTAQRACCMTLETPAPSATMLPPCCLPHRAASQREARRALRRKAGQDPPMAVCQPGTRIPSQDRADVAAASRRVARSVVTLGPPEFAMDRNDRTGRCPASRPRRARACVCLRDFRTGQTRRASTGLPPVSVPRLRILPSRPWVRRRLPHWGASRRPHGLAASRQAAPG